MPLIVWMARKSRSTGSTAAGSFSHSSRELLQALRCSRLSARNSAGVLGQVHGLRQDALYRLENTGRLEGLHHEILGPGLNRFDHQSLLPHGAAHQDLGFGV